MEVEKDEPSKVVLKCGHAIDPGNEEATCHLPCLRPNKNCNNSETHKCPLLCYENCVECPVKIKRISTCGHTVRVKCSQNLDAYICRDTCSKTLPCGHPCLRRCYENCGNCRIIVEKINPACGHKIKEKCEELKDSNCKMECERMLPCSHPCKELCSQKCNPKKCALCYPGTNMQTGLQVDSKIGGRGSCERSKDFGGRGRGGPHGRGGSHGSGCGLDYGGGRGRGGGGLLPDPHPSQRGGGAGNRIHQSGRENENDHGRNSLKQKGPRDGHDGASPYSNGFGEERQCKRKNPTGYMELNEWLALSPNEIALSMNQDGSGYKLLLEDESISLDKMCLLFKVLAKLVTTTSCRRNMFDVLFLTFCKRFINSVIKFQLTIVTNFRKNPNQVRGFFIDQLHLLKAYFQAMPHDALDKIPELMLTIELVLPNVNLKVSGLEETVKQYEELMTYFNDSLKLSEETKKVDPQDRLAILDKVDPYESYRSLTTEPTVDDINMAEKPFIRRNIVDGKYKDVDTYLDVQFRLLREDFVRPLREGIRDYRTNPTARNMNVRMYKNVTFVGSEIIYGKLIFFIQLRFPKKFKIETSKRLLYGNLICLTTDNFVSFHLATVSHKDEKKFKDGIIGISLLSSGSVDLQRSYTVAESRTFFVAYKHVLKALQDLDDKSLPLAEHIVDVQKQVDQPAYLLNNPAPIYDISVVLDCSYMKKTDSNSLFPPSDCVLPEHEIQVPISNGINTWPNKEELKLDESQYEALHAALTRRLAIIQGPPGTGKTFLGLKITQVLLHNSEHWAPPSLNSEKPPILVVCYTNHALDQFLEGMQSFTKKIVRIGGRSKSEAMQNLQINKMISELSRQRKLPRCIYTSNIGLTDEVKRVESTFKHYKLQQEVIQNRCGLIKFKCFVNNGIIPPDIITQFKSNESYISWIINPDCMEYQQAGTSVFAQSLGKLNGETVQKIKPGIKPLLSKEVNVEIQKAQEEEEEDWQDAMDQLQEEENDRANDFEGEEEETNRIVENALKDTRKLLAEAEFEFMVHEFNLKINQLYHELNVRNIPYLEATAKIGKLERQRDCLQIVLSYDSHNIKIPTNINVHTFSFQERCICYASWKEQLLSKYENKERELLLEFTKLSEKKEEIATAKYLYVARQADVVGMTTTGAAQYHAMLKDLQPKIVIIEEAAEILEAHVLTSLTKSCEHLIMIGDHQQLKPSTAVYELAMKYGLETSLFERMIKNGLAYQTLRYQHRMRPEISRLLVPNIYPQLHDAASVHHRPSIRGFTNNVFFITHTERELAESDDNNSHSNPHEATLVMQLARHLILQGYQADQITILTPYSGQFFLLRQEQRKRNACQGIRISILDNFQGEENDIILISWVRSNETGSVGFLKLENRVCVALSRAKLGLYMVGNLDQLCASSPVWKKIRLTLEDMSSVGDTITLRCSNHPDELSCIKTSDELLYQSPEGGCRKACVETLPVCKHPCPRMCHADDLNHENATCTLPCELKCKRDHVCPRLCWQKCPPCTVLVKKILSCEHEHRIECHIRKTAYLCPTKVEKEIPSCEHTVTMLCHQDPTKFVCPVACETRLDCGHSCRYDCHVKKDPEHKKYVCEAPCAQPHKNCSLSGTKDEHLCKLRCSDSCKDCIVIISKKASCGHTSRQVCSDDMLKYRCKENCKKLLPCGHRCPRKCFEACGGCKVMVEKTLEECRHKIKVKCHHTPMQSECNERCERTVQCGSGHPCRQMCKDQCDPAMCHSPVNTGRKCPQGHDLFVPCNKAAVKDTEAQDKCCPAPCGAVLACSHVCAGTCGSCLHGRLHVPCASMCNRPLVCGHVCKYPCSAACPPCQQPCAWRCQHSKCKQQCGYQCTPCMEDCIPACPHQKPCGKKCGAECPCVLCERSCLKTLACGHPCVGLCGDACPTLCRECDADELTTLLFGDEDGPDARFVQLIDCKHVIEYEGLKEWLNQQGDGSIGMKQCPKCKQPIYNSMRFKQVILQSYKNVRVVISKQFAAQLDGAEIVKRMYESGQQIALPNPGQQMALLNPFPLRNLGLFDLNDLHISGQPPTKKLAIDPKLLFLLCIKNSLLVEAVKSSIDVKNSVDKNKVEAKRCQVEWSMLLKKTNSLQWHLYNFQIDIIKRASKVCEKLRTDVLKQQVHHLVAKVMKQTHRISSQMMMEASCELQRIETSESVNALKGHSHTDAQEYFVKINLLMSTSVVFTNDIEIKVKHLLKEAEKLVGGLGISNTERLAIVKAMGGSAGHWYKCPNGHIYYIGDCGGAQVTSRCNECRAIIGGSSHRLTTGNEHAPEMDGSRQAAWPPH